MKIIHCADLHLDSKLGANLNKVKAKARKGEILHTFERMVMYAADHGVSAILISGDLFDIRNISATARNTVLFAIKQYSDIDFYYLQGNHDKDNFLSGEEEIPQNLKLFGGQWKSYETKGGKITISGLELNSENHGSAYISLVLDANKFNIVMLHGQEAESVVKDKAEIINLKELRNKGIDYLALGHIHAYKKEVLDPRGSYCYPGCLEGRGFDECGEHGFVLLDIDESTGQYSHEFISFAQRKLYAVEVDVTGCESTAEMLGIIRDTLKLKNIESESMLKVVLKGNLEVTSEKDIDYMLSSLEPSYFFVKIYDETRLHVKVEDYLLDESLKGEFVRQVLKDEALSEEEKNIIIRYGLQALSGEEVQ